MTRIVVAALSCLLAIVAAGQTDLTHLHRLNVGDKVPDVNILHISQPDRTSAHFNDFRGKWVILDFWWTGCAGCIESFPKMKQLRDSFSDRLQILLVNYQSEAQIKKAFRGARARNAGFTLVNLPSVTSDSVFERLFPHTLVPHEVWIDDRGVVRAITHAQDVTAVNIERMMASKDETLPEKRDFLLHDPAKPLLPQIYPVDPGVVRYSSSVFSYYEGLRGPVTRIAIDSFNGTGRITRPNFSLLELVGEAVLGRDPSYNTDIYKSADFDFGKRIELVTTDTAKYLCRTTDSKERAEWNSKHRFSYESVFPLEEQEERYRVMLQTLSDYFKIRVMVEQRQLPCLVLVRTSSADKFEARHNLVDSLINRKITQLYHSRMEYLRQMISFANKNTPWIFKDETGYNGEIEVELSSRLGDIPALRKELRDKYDLDLVEKTSAVDVLVIKDVGK